MPAPSSDPLPLSLCDFALPIFRNGLGALLHILEEGRRFVNKQGLNGDKVYVQARLIDDQLPLVFQVQNAIRTVFMNLDRMTGNQWDLDGPFNNNEKTFEELEMRVSMAQLEVRELMKERPHKRDEDLVDIVAGGRPLKVTVTEAVQFHGIPNFIFHVTTAYSILRAKGVPLGKADFILGFVGWRCL